MVFLDATPVLWILSFVLLLSSLGVILARKPVHASLSFLLTLLTLASIYLQLSAEFIAVLQVLVYAGAIMVLFMFVIILFQDAHYQINEYPAQSLGLFLFFAGLSFLVAMIFLARNFINIDPVKEHLPEGHGSVQSLGTALYTDFFFPFEAVVLLFLVAVVGALYIGKKVR